MAVEKNYERNGLLRAIIKANPKVPSPDFIQTYKDLLKTKDYFRYYNFHPKVFESLFHIGHHKFFSHERYDKNLLFEAIRVYYVKRPKNYSYSNEILEKAIQLFKTSILLDHPEAKRCARALIIDKELPHYFIDWLIENWEVSEVIVNTLLRYPVHHDKIGEWGNEVYENESLRARRSELIGLKLNQDKYFKVHSQTIVADIEYYIQDEISTYKKFINRFVGEHNSLEDEYGERTKELEEISFHLNNHFIGHIPVLDTSIYDRSTIMEQIADVEGFLKFYGIEKLMEIYKYKYKHHQLFKANDQDSLKLYEIYPKMLFYSKYEEARIMVWGIYYSKLPKRTKEKMIMEYPATGKMFFVIKYIAIKMKSTKLLKWLIVISDLEAKSRSSNNRFHRINIYNP